MNLLTLLLRLPFLPVRGLVQLGELVQQQVEQELRDPANVRRQLEEIQEARVHGEVSDEEVARVEGEAVSRLIRPSPGAGRNGETR